MKTMRPVPDSLGRKYMQSNVLPIIQEQIEEWHDTRPSHDEEEGHHIDIFPYAFWNGIFHRLPGFCFLCIIRHLHTRGHKAVFDTN